MIDKNIDLSRDLTEEDIRQLEEEADLIEKAAKKAEEEAKKLDKVEKKVDDQTKRINNKIGKVVKASNNLTSSRSPLGALGGNQRFTDDMIQGTRFGEGGSGLPANFKDRSSRAPAAYGRGPNYEEPPPSLSLRERIVREEQYYLQKAQQGASIAGNPLGFVQSQIFDTLAKYGLPLAAVLTISKQLLDIWKAQFEDGGIFDVRKLVQDEVKQYMELNVINAINRGELYFGSSGEVLSQQAPKFSNTQRLVYGHMTDILTNAGQ